MFNSVIDPIFCADIFVFAAEADKYMFKVNNRNSRLMCWTCTKLTIKTSEWRLCSAFIKHIYYIDLVFHCLTLNMDIPDGFILQIWNNEIAN